MKKETQAKFFIALFTFTSFCTILFVRMPKVVLIELDAVVSRMSLDILFPATCVFVISACLFYYVDFILIKWGFYAEQIITGSVLREKLERLERELIESRNQISSFRADINVFREKIRSYEKNNKDKDP